MLLYHVLQWFMGSPDAPTIQRQFDMLPGVVAGVAVGGALWGYHWAVARQEAGIAEHEVAAARRAYRYLVSAVGLVTLGVGLVAVVAVAVGVLSPDGGPDIAGRDWWRNPLVLAITLLMVGAPVWGLHWREIQRAVGVGESEERAAQSRRVFIYVIFGVGVLLTLINMSVVLFQLFDAALGSGSVSEVLWEVRWSVGILVAAGSVSIYYWLVLREDRAATAGLELPEAAAAPARKSVTALVAEMDLDVVRRLEARLGYGVRVWRRTDAETLAPTINDEEMAETEQRILEAESNQVLVLVDAGGIRVIPHQGSWRG